MTGHQGLYSDNEFHPGVLKTLPNPEYWSLRYPLRFARAPSEFPDRSRKIDPTLARLCSSYRSRHKDVLSTNTIAEYM